MGKRIAFIGGGNMANAMIGGLLRQGMAVADLDVVEPFADAQQKLQAEYGITARQEAGEFLNKADLVIWAVKPQIFKEATESVKGFTTQALHLSVAAGILSDSIAQWLGTERVVRCMPNTPALIGKGISGLYARDPVSPEDRLWAEQVMSGTGESVWLTTESQLDAVTALSGSGPAYVFYFMEAMTAAGVSMGLDQDQAYKLAVSTFIGAGELAKASTETPEVLRQRVTSKGGTTYAAITSMDESDVKGLFTKALFAAQQRAKELGEVLR